MKKSRYNVTVDDGCDCVIANTMTGAVAKVTGNDWKNYLSGDLTDDFWEENGFVIDNKVDELDLLRNVYKAAQNNKNVARITICPTLDCNFSCSYCYERREKGKMSEKVQERILEKIRQLYEIGIEKINVTWYGGEPLLCKDIIFDMSKEIISIAENYVRKCDFAIITNGSLIDKEVIDIFRDIKMKTIQMTLDGDKDIHDKRRKYIDGSSTFDDIVNNIKILLEVGMNVNIRVNIDKDNVNGYNAIRHYFKQYKGVNCYPAFVTEESTQNILQREKCIKNSEKKFFMKNFKIDYHNVHIEEVIRPEVGICMAIHKYSYVFSYDGNVYKCINDVSMPWKAIGNIMNEVVNDEESCYGQNIFNDENCSMCSYLPLCYGRCSWEYTEKREHTCSDIKYLLKDILRYKYLRKEEKFNDNYSEAAKDHC